MKKGEERLDVARYASHSMPPSYVSNTARDWTETGSQKAIEESCGEAKKRAQLGESDKAPWRYLLCMILSFDNVREEMQPSFFPQSGPWIRKPGFRGRRLLIFRYHVLPSRRWSSRVATA